MDSSLAAISDTLAPYAFEEPELLAELTSKAFDLQSGSN